MNKKLRHEFQKGFALSTSGEILAVIDGYRTRALARNELRTFAARLEATALHEKSRVDVARIVNKKSGMEGVRRLSQSQIDRAGEKVDAHLASLTELISEAPRPKAIPRRVLQHIAQGRCTKVEAILLLMYCQRRISQTKPLQRLIEGERYARFRFAELEALSGIPRANLSRALKKLEAKGFLGTVDVAKQNENAYGLCFVDGPLISLVRHRQETRHARRARLRKKTTTPPVPSDNTPTYETTSLRKGYPKRVPKKRQLVTEGRSARCTQNEWERILLRAQQMKAEQMDQAA